MALSVNALKSKGSNTTKSPHGSDMRRLIKKNTAKKRRMHLKQLEQDPRKSYALYWAW